MDGSSSSADDAGGGSGRASVPRSSYASSSLHSSRPLSDDGSPNVDWTTSLPGGRTQTGSTDAVDVAGCLSHSFPPVIHGYSERDAILYALSVGCNAVNAADPIDLRYTYESHPDGQLLVLPTLAVTWPHPLLAELVNIPSLRFNPMMLLHGEQELVLPSVRQLPPCIGQSTVSVSPDAAPESIAQHSASLASAGLVTTGRIANVYDKGSGALVIVEAITRGTGADSATVYAMNRSSIFIRGIGNFGGDRGPAVPPSAAGWAPPPQAPSSASKAVATMAVHVPTTPSQALLYRLNGDTNPLHVDPTMASMGGFDAPILHGLCSMGIAARVLVRSFCFTGDGGDAESATGAAAVTGSGGSSSTGSSATLANSLTAVRCRFVKHVFPGDVVVVEAWQGDDAAGGPAGDGSEGGGGSRTVFFQCKVVRGRTSEATSRASNPRSSPPAGGGDFDRDSLEVVLSHGVAVFDKPVVVVCPADDRVDGRRLESGRMPKL